MVAHAASFDAVALTLLRVRAALLVKHEDWGREEDEAREALVLVALGVASMLVMDVQLLFSVNRIARMFVYIPLTLLPLHLIGGAIVIGLAARRYARYLARPRKVWAHPDAALLADPRWPLWQAMVRAEEQCNALYFYTRCMPLRHRKLGLHLLSVVQKELREARRDILLLQLLYDMPGSRGIVLSAAHRQMVVEATAALERNSRVMEAFRVSRVE